MAFDTIVAGEDMNAANIQQVIDCLAGTSGGGQQILLNQYNNSSNYALTVRNLDTTNGYALKVTDAADAVLIQAYKNTLQLGAAAANDTLSILCNISGKVFIGDSANASLTVGLTINQAANDDEIISLKSSDVAHGVTGETETDTYAFVKKYSGTDGGALIEGLCDTGTIAVRIAGVSVSDNTTKSTSGQAVVSVQAYKKSGTSAGAPGTDANMFGIADNSNFKFLFDFEGDSHEDGTGWTAYDDWDDIQLLDLVNTSLVKAKADPIKSQFWTWVSENAKLLQDLKLITFNDDGHHFINRSKMQELLVGAVRQLGQQMSDTQARLALTEQRLAALPPAA